MAKTRWTGRGAVVGTYSTSNSSYTPVGLSRSVTPPPQEKGAIDCTGMEDTYVVVRPGLEQESVFTFTSLHASTDTQDAAMQTTYTNHTEKNWYIRRYIGEQMWTSRFKGYITALRPQTFTGNDPVTWEVQVHRTSAITHSVSS